MFHVSVARRVARRRATRRATINYLEEYCLARAENQYPGVLAHAEHDGIGFKVIAATSRDMLPDVARHVAPQLDNSRNTA